MKRKGRVERAIKLDNGNSKEYKIKTIGDNKVYVKELDSGHLPGLYYLVLWKGCPKEKNI